MLIIDLTRGCLLGFCPLDHEVDEHLRLDGLTGLVFYLERKELCCPLRHPTSRVTVIDDIGQSTWFTTVIGFA